jgi:hypothetical protein
MYQLNFFKLFTTYEVYLIETKIIDSYTVAILLRLVFTVPVLLDVLFQIEH